MLAHNIPPCRNLRAIGTAGGVQARSSSGARKFSNTGAGAAALDSCR
jgi:hypothetical protein